MGREIVLDGYPFKHYRWSDGKFGYREPKYRFVRLYLIEKYGVCYFCNIPVKDYPHQENIKAWQPDDYATIDHLKPRQYRKKYEVVKKVLACYRCNQARNEVEQNSNCTY